MNFFTTAVLWSGPIDHEALGQDAATAAGVKDLKTGRLSGGDEHHLNASKPRQDAHLDAEVERACGHLKMRGRGAVQRSHGLIKFDLWMSWQSQHKIAGQLFGPDSGDDHDHLTLETRRRAHSVSGARGRGRGTSALRQSGASVHPDRIQGVRPPHGGGQNDIYHTTEEIMASVMMMKCTSPEEHAKLQANRTEYPTAGRVAR